jgi:hypothetical protein
MKEIITIQISNYLSSEFAENIHKLNGIPVVPNGLTVFAEQFMKTNILMIALKWLRRVMV